MDEDDEEQERNSINKIEQGQIVHKSGQIGKERDRLIDKILLIELVS